MTKYLFLLFLIAAEAASLTVNLDIQIPDGVVSDAVKTNMIKNIEASRDIWADKLGFSSCYPGVAVKVTVVMIKAEDQPRRAFMDATSLEETFVGSRRIANGDTAKITFKSRPFRDEGDPSRKTDTTWFLTPNPMAVNSVLWPSTSCDIWTKPCKSTTAGGQFDFFTHMAHEFGHVFGFVGSLFAANIDTSVGGAGSFRGIGSDGKPFTFQFSGNTSHAKTSVMSLGFSEMQRALPNTLELEALRAVFGYAGTIALSEQNVVIPASGEKVVELSCGSDFKISCIELSSFATTGAPSVSVKLESPDGTVATIGALRAGWAREGYVKPDLATAARSSYNPTDTLAAFRGKDAKGTWKIRYMQSGPNAITLPGVALWLRGAPVTSVVSGKRAYSQIYASYKNRVVLQVNSGTLRGKSVPLFDLRGRAVRGDVFGRGGVFVVSPDLRSIVR